MKKKNKPGLSAKLGMAFLGLLVLGGILLTVVTLRARKPGLPYLGERGHRAGVFSFINQNGKEITDRLVQNKVTVVEYFFTSCPSICPRMNKNLKEVYNEFKTDSNFIILSHTSDPDNDSVKALRLYAGSLGADAPSWQFLTGNKADLYKAANRDYLLAAEDSGPGAFIHTEYVALLDKQRRIRGFYDATNEEKIKKLESDISMLLNEKSN